MNPINSVLIEGAAISDPEMAEKNGQQVCTFNIMSTRFTLKDGARHRELSFFHIETLSERVTAECMQLSRGNGIRIVGRMTSEAIHDRGGVEHFKTIILAESVEIKPKFEHKEPV